MYADQPSFESSFERAVGCIGEKAPTGGPKGLGIAGIGGGG